MVEAAGIEPASEEPFHKTSTSLFPPLFSSEKAPGDGLFFGTRLRFLAPQLQPSPWRGTARPARLITPFRWPQAEPPKDDCLQLGSKSEVCVRSYIVRSAFLRGRRTTLGLQLYGRRTPSKPCRPHIISIIPYSAISPGRQGNFTKNHDSAREVRIHNKMIEI